MSEGFVHIPIIGRLTGNEDTTMGSNVGIGMATSSLRVVLDINNAG
jgi:hypothetical protein